MAFNSNGKPVFAAYEPAFLGLVERINLSESDRTTYEGVKELRGDTKRITLYFDGELESLMGFDIPAWLSGIITLADEQPCVAVLPSGDVLDAVMVLRHGSRRHYGLIVLLKEIDRAREALKTVDKLGDE